MLGCALWRIELASEPSYLYVKQQAVWSSKLFFTQFRRECQPHEAGSRRVCAYSEASRGWYLAVNRSSYSLFLVPPSSYKRAATFHVPVDPPSSAIRRAYLKDELSGMVLCKPHQSVEWLETCERAKGMDQWQCKQMRESSASVAMLSLECPAPGRCSRHCEVKTRCVARETVAPAPLEQASQRWQSLQFKISRSVVKVGSRRVIVATYLNVARLDWLKLFCDSLFASRITRFFVLALDSLTCSAATMIGCHNSVQCATPSEFEEGADSAVGSGASRLREEMQEWSTEQGAGYFVMLQHKLRLALALLRLDLYVVIADVDVLALHADFLPRILAMHREGRWASNPAKAVATGASTGSVHDLVRETDAEHDLVISSDTRSGRFEARRCPASRRYLQHHSVDWVCAGLFSLRPSAASDWFVSEVIRLMQIYSLTDQDAMQTVLSGHVQVVRLSPPTNTSLRVYDNTLRFAHEGQFNAPIRADLRTRLAGGLKDHGFKWSVLPLTLFANGPLIGAWLRENSNCSVCCLPDGWLSAHSNCHVKERMEASTVNTRMAMALLLPRCGTQMR
mmetsp:Transcript_7117/g.15578  ORF Transcript_7117/g.15578 Transcript_7117/m.15578 type:complete len:565 (-) Transcript_7117:114-1808(-)|eukprot:CAMPEP_0183338184 /NCGR_PEP_ID=MMETSP0164_2-20130417/5571_1 /TAXON_ID=221442 /ORGANISM="Coccolithus pelagicus ssp braarudi, Strain PLY182g" /LENGTH=564 /DNA_ID=CAMNT_0025507995 /DNA_START=118 /DNA_END=1812 /DNA_ORIENTATION=-